MIITRTPFRVTLGGGGTDLPSYYEKHGGFLLTSAIDKYMYVAINTPFIDNLLRVKYSKSETVAAVHELQHELAREALKHFEIADTLEILSFADISAGTGMGSSSCYLTGLLNALRAYTRRHISVQALAELACDIEINRLKKPVGKQDAYIASYGGILIMDISRDGTVKPRVANIKMATIRDLEHNILLYFSGVQRSSEVVLGEVNRALAGHSAQKSDAGNSKQVEESLHHIKDLGYQSLKALEEGKLSQFARLMDTHWQHKKKMSSKISFPTVDQAYEEAKKLGAIGGKLLGAGGGGFLMLYTENHYAEIDLLMKGFGFKKLDFRFDFEGSKVLLNLTDSRLGYMHHLEKNNLSCPE